jgi:4-aminobutyrate aminotransferase-like enzyme
LNPHVVRAPYPHPYRPPPALAGTGDVGAAALAEVTRLLDGPGSERIGCVIIEPVQGRGGDVVPPPGFLSGLAELCRARDVVLVFDEIYCGLGRTGYMHACEDESVLPDLLCIGKALSGSLPVAACFGPAAVMDAWPESTGEAKHTSTFLGNPLACAAAIAALREIDRYQLAGRAAEEGARAMDRMRVLADRHSCVGEIRGRGLMIGIDLVRDRSTREPDAELAHRVVTGALLRGWLLLPGGPDGNVISLSPPLTISRALIDRSIRMLDEVLAEATADSSSAGS